MFILLAVLILCVGGQTVCYGQSERVVKLFYFLPNDRTHKAYIVEEMKTGILEVQSFYREQMEAHGYGAKTFRIETDAQGTPIVHRVNGDHSDGHYKNRGRPENEISRAFDTSSIVQFVVMDISTSSGGLGVGIKQRGMGVIYGRWNTDSAAHELGHAFGLQHDFRADSYIMSYGNNRNVLSRCAADFLSVNPYFNSGVPLQQGSLPSVQLTSSTQYSYGVESVPVTVRVQDPDGVHQVFLSVMTPEGAGFRRPSGFLEVVDCRRTIGPPPTDFTVTFRYRGYTPSGDDTSLLNQLRHTVYVSAVDKQGNRIDSPQKITLQAINIKPAKVPVSQRSPGVRDSIYNNVRIFLDRSVSSYDHITDAHLAEIGTLFVNGIDLLSAPLKYGDFDGLTNLSRLELRNVTGYWGIQTLPRDMFKGKTSLGVFSSSTYFPFEVKLQKVGANQFKVLVPTGAPFDIELPLVIANGSINGGATSITIPTGSTESDTFTVTRTPGTKSAVLVDIEKFPILPERHSGYGFQKSHPGDDGLGPILKIFDALPGAPAPLNNRTPAVREAIIRAIPEINLDDLNKEIRVFVTIGYYTVTLGFSYYANYVSEAHLAAITSLNLSNAGITELKPEDFNSLPNLTVLNLASNKLSSLPRGIFDKLTNLTELKLAGNELNSLIPTTVGGIPDIPIFRKPSAIFDELTALTNLDLGGNNLSSLPSGVFDELNNLTTLELDYNDLSSLSESIFDELTRMTKLDLAGNDLTLLPAGIFDQLNNLIILDLNSNVLSSLPAGILDNSTNLVEIDLEGNDLSSLPAGIFDQLNNLIGINLSENRLRTLPPDIFYYLASLIVLDLSKNQLSSLPPGIFEGLFDVDEHTVRTLLTRLYLVDGEGPLSLEDINAAANRKILFLNGNTVDPLPLTVSLVHAAGDQFKAVAPLGAPFDIVLPITLTNGNIDGGATSITIPTGSVESQPLTVTRTPRTTDAVTVDIGSPLPSLPPYHHGYALVKSEDLPIIFTQPSSVLIPVSERTPEVRDAIVDAVPGVNTAEAVTAAHLAAITSIEFKLNNSVKVGDFDGLTGLTTMGLGTGELTSLPPGLFKDLSGVTYMEWYGEKLSTLPVGAFEGFTNLNIFALTARQLTSLRPGVFDPLTNLTEFALDALQLNTLPVGVFDRLTNLTHLGIYGNQLHTLPDGIFDQLTNLTSLSLNGQLTNLPDGIFSGLSSLTSLDLSRNAVDPLPLTVSLEKVGPDQFKAVMPTGAPFEVVLPIRITNGSINGGATTLTIPKGSVESQPLTVTRAPSTTFAVAVNIGELPSIPTDTNSRGGRLHTGYALVKSIDLPLEFGELGGRVFTPVSERTLQVQNAILNRLPDIDSVNEVTKAHLAGITELGLGALSLFGNQSDPAIAGATALKLGDFDGLKSLTTLWIVEENLSSVPAGVFNGLVSLESLFLMGTFSSLPVDVFDGLVSLETLILGSTQLNNLPSDVFDEPSNLTSLALASPLNTLPADIFDNLTALTKLTLGNRLENLPSGIFNNLTALTELYLGENLLGRLPSGIFNHLTALTTLDLENNQLGSLPAGIFDNLTAIKQLNLESNQLSSLPDGVFNELATLSVIGLSYNQLASLPDDVFRGLTALTTLRLRGNTVDPLPLTVSLQKVADGQFKAVVPTGAPFDIVLRIRDTYGGPFRELTIAAGSKESEVLTVTRTAGTSHRVSVWIGPPLPSLPANHSGYELVNSTPRDHPLVIFEDTSEQIWSGTITVGTWGNAFGNGNATGFGYDRRNNAGSISNPTFTYRGTTYTINGFGFAKVGNNPAHKFVLTISPGFPACDKKLLRFGGFKLADALNGSAYGSHTYIWEGQWAIWEPIGRQRSYSITLHPTVPDAPAAVSATNEGNQVTLSWETPCDGGIDIIRHEYRQKTRNGAFGSWMPIPNSGAGGANVASYTITSVNNPEQYIYEVRAVNKLGTSDASAPVSPTDRTPQVAEGILDAVRRNDPSVSSFADITDSHLAGITVLALGYRNINALKSGDFDGLTGVTELRLPGNQLTSLPADIFDELTALTTLHLNRNRLTSLPDSIFEGLTGLTTLYLGGNAVNPLPLTVFLEKVGADQFKAVAPAGAPFDIVLPLSVSNASISGGATSVTIPAGSVESELRTVTRYSGTTAAVTVNIGTLPRFPTYHYGYTLVKSGTLPLTFPEQLTKFLPVSQRTPQVRDAIVRAAGVNSADEVTEAHLAGIWQLDLESKSISSLKVGDFDGLTSLNGLFLRDNQLTTLPSGIFDKLTALSTLNLNDNRLSTLPAGIFDKLTGLNYLSLTDNSLTTLPSGIFEEQSELIDIWLDGNRFTTLPVGIFKGLTPFIALRKLYLEDNTVDPLPLTVSLEKVADGEFKAVAPAGATFDFILPLTVTNGSINGGDTSITISKGEVESDTLNVTRTPGTTDAVTVDIGTLPSKPSGHSGYALVKSDSLPLEVKDVSTTDPVRQETAVNIPDAKLRAKIETNLGKASGDPITAAEMETLTTITAQDASISNLTGLETATNLTTLKLGNNSVSNISALAGLTKLTELQLWDNTISDISHVAGLTNLTRLYLWGNGISDISPVSGLINLTRLYLGENSISNISAVAGLTTLTHLYLNENSLSSISAIAGLTNLTELRIGDNTISNISAVANLTNLVWLDMPNNSITDISTVTNLTNLTGLTVTNNAITDISAVTNLTKLIEVFLDENSISDISPLVVNAGLGANTEIYVQGNVLSYPSIYTHIPALQARDVYVDFDNRMATAPVKISGDTQEGVPSTTLAQPFVVEVRDANSVVFAGVPVTFTVTAGGGTLSAINTATDANGRAQSTLMLGNTAGTNSVRVSVTGITQTITFTATATTTPVVSVSPIINRTPQVRDAIVAAIPGVSNANDVTEAHLTAIRTLNLSRKSITSLKTGDFSGLSALSTLYLNDNQLTNLPEDLFFGLTSLKNLYFNQNNLSSLPAGLFDGLTSLTQISLHTNRLTNLPVNVFSGLTSLARLFLHNNRLAHVPAKVFSGLSALKYLYLHNNQLTDLPPEVFSELPALIQLLIHNNELPALPTKVFSGLTAPTLLWLHGNTVNPLPLTISLDEVGTSQFKAAVDAGAPFTIVLSLTVENGSISSGTTTLTIPAGDVESRTLTVNRTHGTTAAVTVDIGTLPGLPTGHKGYQLAKSTELPLTIIGAPGNNAPVFTEDSSTTRTIAENTAAGVNIGNPVAATDADNDTLTYSLSATDSASFSIVSNSGQLQTRAAIDYETKTTYTITVTVSDGSLSDTITVTINVADIDESPTDTGVCKVGDILSPGESCTYPDTDAVFSVLDNGHARWNVPGLPAWLAWINQTSIGGSISVSATVNSQAYHFVAEERSGDSWEIKEIGDDRPQQPETPEQPEQPGETGGTPTLSVSTTTPLTEATLHGGIVTLNLSGGTYESSTFDIRRSLTVSGITGADFETFSVVRVSDTRATVELEFDGNLSTNGTLTFNLESDAITNYEGAALTSQIAVPAVTESIAASTDVPLTEAALDESVVTLTLSGRKFEHWNSRIRTAVSVSGISGVTARRFDIDRVSDTQVTVELTFDGNINTDSTLTFTVGAGAIAGYDGPALTAQVAVTANTESVVASTASPLTGATLDESVVTLTLSGRNFARSVWDIRDAVSTSGISGVTVGSFDIDRKSDTQVTVELAFDGNITTDSTLTFTVGAGAIAEYNGTALTTQLFVSANTEAPTETDTQPDTADARTAFESTTPTDYTRVTLRNSGRVGGVPTQYTTDSDVGTVAYMALGKLMECSFADAEVDRQSIVYIKKQSLGRLSNFESETVCGKTSSTWTTSWSAARITHLRFFDESSTPSVREAFYNVATGQIELPGTSQQPPADTTNNAPVFSDGTSTTRKIAENTAAGVNIGSAVTATDADNDALTYTLGGTDANAFSIVNTNGQLKTKSTLDYETKTAYSVTVTVSDGNLTDTISVTINVTDIDETLPNNAPVFSEGASTTRTIAENTAAGVNIGSAITAADADNHTLTYSLSGTDSASFSIVRTTGQLQTRASLDYETKSSYTVTVAVSDDNGGSDSITVTINITDENDSTTTTTETPTLSALSTTSLTEATLNGSVVFLTLSGGTYVRSIWDIRDAVSTSGISGVTFDSFFDVDRESDTQVTIELTFSGNMTSDGTLTFTVGAAAIANYSGSALTAQITVTAITESVAASSDATLAEATLHESVVTLTLTGAKYARSIFEIRNAVTVDGIDGVTIPWHQPDRESDTQITVELEVDSINLDTISTLTFIVGADAIANYSGPALTAQIQVTANTESVVASAASPLTEATLDESVVTLTLSGRKYARSVWDIRDAVSLSGISGVTIDRHFHVERESDTQVTVELTFSGNMTSDGTLTFTVGADAIAKYNGPALTAQLTVTASRENALMANFPNPFNPETWIPYELEKPADVVLTFYALNGREVRRLALGYQPAGVYQSRKRAAYWDGKNELGEFVASGIYFYSLTANEFSATRKMLISK